MTDEQLEHGQRVQTSRGPGTIVGFRQGDWEVCVELDRAAAASRRVWFSADEVQAVLV